MKTKIMRTVFLNSYLIWSTDLCPWSSKLISNYYIYINYDYTILSIFRLLFIFIIVSKKYYMLSNNSIQLKQTYFFFQDNGSS